MEKLINQIDEILAGYEDWMHGVDGENCTIARSKLASLQKQLMLGGVVGQSEQFICKKCGSSEMYLYTKTKDKCENCGNIQYY